MTEPNLRLMCFGGTMHIGGCFHPSSNEALKMSSGIDVYGQPIWYLVMCLMLAWIVVFFCLIKGIKSTGKVEHLHFNLVLVHVDLSHSLYCSF